MKQVVINITIIKYKLMKLMAGIVFIRTSMLDELVTFYTEVIGANKWLSQPDIEILQHGNLLFGFQQASTTDLDVLLTFFFETKSDVDQLYNKVKRTAVSAPNENTKYKIYNFFAKDPEGRKIEGQTFLHKLPPY